jgi:hypothetical protein
VAVARNVHEAELGLTRAVKGAAWCGLAMTHARASEGSAELSRRLASSGRKAEQRGTGVGDDGGATETEQRRLASFLLRGCIRSEHKKASEGRGLLRLTCGPSWPCKSGG